MIRLRLPDPPSPPPTPARAVVVLLSRRQFLKALGAAAVVAATPWTRAAQSWAAARGRFFTARERRTLEALVESILPADADPGAKDLKVVRYIEQFLAAFDQRVPMLYAGGPYSGRHPFINHETGVPGRRRPKNSFRRFVPPTRLQSLYWRWQLVGTAGLPPGEQALVAPLDAQRGGPLPGLRDIYREGLVALDALSRTQEGAAFLDLDAAGRGRVRDAARRALPVPARRDKNFIDQVVQHTIEGAFSAPEYGGNRRGRGWKLLGLEGDSQPLGYALYSRAIDGYRERADQPLSTPNPDELAGPKPLTAEGDLLERIISAVQADSC